MPNLLWFDWEKDAQGYSVHEFKPEELELMGDAEGMVEIENFGTVPKGELPLHVYPKKHFRFVDGASDGTKNLFSKLPLYTLMDHLDLPYFLTPLGGRIEKYRPLDEHPGLFMEFADLPESAEACVGFANRFGLLDRWSKAEPLVYWFIEISGLRNAVKKWEKAKKSNDFSELLKLLDGKFRKGNANVILRRGPDERHPALFISPNNLTSALWLQFAQAVSANTGLRRCAWCSTWFAFGTGTGRRKSAHYCSDRCRKAAFIRRRDDLAAKQSGTQARRTVR